MRAFDSLNTGDHTVRFNLIVEIAFAKHQQNLMHPAVQICFHFSQNKKKIKTNLQNEANKKRKNNAINISSNATK